MMMTMANGDDGGADLDHRMDDAPAGNGAVAAATGADEGSAPMEVPAPVVFQCSECKTIVGDSSTIASMDPVNRTMSIKRKTDAIVVSPELKTSTEEADFGSTFHLFFCANCKQALGQVYRTTSSKLDYLRDLFTFHSDQLIFYQLFPDPELMAAETPQTQPQQEPKQEEKPGTRELKPEEEPKKTSLVKPAANQSDLEIEILKLQKFCTFLHDRMLKMEDELERCKSSASSNYSSKSLKRHH